ncbi:minor capsid protein [Nocardioides sp. SYSU D00065]|uniref:minor capsid protein n=1 Tax=Nocardioides sp. SYSU D00065 TaxID=2817378 RepID=UPI001B319DCE|nr:minor capsid protein [Nocardioides sp. SYSU D00065]
MAVTARTLRLQQALSRELDKILDAQQRALVSAWVDAWDEVAPDLTAALLEMLVAGETVTRAQLLRSTRLRRALAVVADNVEQLAHDAGVRITGDLRDVIDRAGSAQASVIDSQLPPDTDLVAVDAWSRVDDRQIDAIVRRSTEQITALTRALPAAAYDVVRRELIRGVAAGSNPRETARRMITRAEKYGFNGGLNRALVIARTETLDAHRDAARLGRMAHADVLGGWTWMAKLDTRTCPSCWAQHGSVHPIDKTGPDDHQQGRCTALPTTRSWADLGLDVAEPPSLLPSREEAFEALTGEQQLQVLGPGRYTAYANGTFPMDDWSVVKSTPGWRDSHVVAPVPQSGGRSSRSAA